MIFRCLNAFALLLIVAQSRGETVKTSGPFDSAFAEIHRTVAERFFDARLNGLDWDAIGAVYSQRAAKAASLDEFSAVVNEMLAKLNASHTHLYTSRNPGFYQLRSIFGDEGTQYCGIGIFTKQIDGEVFISGVLEASPAHQAGLRVGDRIISINDQPFHPIASFESRAGLPTSVAVQRLADDPMPQQIEVVPATLDPRELFVNAIKASARFIAHESQRIAYIRMWSWAGEPYRQALRESLQRREIRAADAFILDLRDGWGGANPEDINLFNDRVPVLTFIRRNGEEHTLAQSWRKPLVLLVNEGTRSGKEVLAYSCQKHGLAKIVGTRTAGAVLGGNPIPIGPDMLLYLATVDIRADGERLEGVGVTPDVEVEFELPYANGADPQLDAAVEALSP